MTEREGASRGARLRTEGRDRVLHAGVVVVAMAAGSALQFFPQLGVLAFLETMLGASLDPMVYEAALVPWYVLPVAYAALALGRRAALLALFFTVVVLASRFTVLTARDERALLGLHALTAVASAAIVIWLAGLWRAARDRALETARGAEERHRALVEFAALAIISADKTGAIVSWNRQAREMFGYEAEEVVGKPLSALVPEGLVGAFEAELARLHADPTGVHVGRTQEYYGLRKDGGEF